MRKNDLLRVLTAVRAAVDQMDMEGVLTALASLEAAPAKPVGRPVSYDWASMEPGDSFKYGTDNLASARVAASQASRQYRMRFKAWDDKPFGVHIRRKLDDEK